MKRGDEGREVEVAVVADAKRMPAKSTLNGALDLLKTLVVGCAVLWLLVVRAAWIGGRDISFSQSC